MFHNKIFTLIRSVQLPCALASPRSRYLCTVQCGFTKSQKEQYDKNGFFLVKGLIPQDKVDMYNKRFQDIATGKVTNIGNMLVMKDIVLVKDKQKQKQTLDASKVTKLQNFERDEIFFNQYCQDPGLMEYIKGVCGTKGAKVMHSMLINKPPDLGKGTSRHPLHQDLLYFPFRPASKIVASWTALQDITKENGCLVVIPGSHQAKLLPHGYPATMVNKAYYGILGMDSEDDIKKHKSVEMKAGDTIFFHPLLIHGSGMNKSTSTRRAISGHFADVDCFYMDQVDEVQEEVKKEIEEMMAKKAKKQIIYNDFWRNKSRLVYGSDKGTGI